MRRLLIIVLFLLIGFYIAWPALTAWQIHGALKSGDTAQLASKVDFPSVRRSLAPAVEAKIAARVEKLKTAGGSTGNVLGQVLKGDILRRVTQVVLDHLVTPENVIKLARQPGTLSQKIDRLVAEELSKVGGIAGIAGDRSGSGDTIGRVTDLARKFGVKIDRPNTAPAAAPATSPAPDAKSAERPPSLGLANVKHVSLADPLTLRIGVARHPEATEADVTAELGFNNFDWKLTGLAPRLD